MLGACALLTVLLAGPLIPVANKADSVKVVQPEGGLGLPYSVGTYTFLDGPYVGQTVTMTIPQMDGLTKTLDKNNDSVVIGYRSKSYMTWTADAIAGVASDTLISSFTRNAAGTTTASTGSYTITSGKTLRITTISFCARTGAAAVNWSRFYLRNNAAGATINTSAVVGEWEIEPMSATSGTGNSCTSLTFPDGGLEFVGDGTNSIGMSHIAAATTNVETITIAGYEYLTP